MKKYRLASFLILVFALLLAFFLVNTETTDSRFKIKYGLDLSGGTHLVYRADTATLDSSDVSDAMASLRDVIERRVNLFGVSEPVVQVEKGGFGGESEERLIVELPGITDVDEAVALIGKTPLLEFKLVDQQALLAENLGINVEGANVVVKGIEQRGPDGELIESTQNSEAQESSDGYIETGLTGRLLKKAQLQFGSGPNSGGLANQATVLVTFNTEGSNIFAELTRENVGEQLAIFLDGEVLSAPVIREVITGGTAVISGNFDPEEARTLVRDLNLGALPVPIELISTQSIGATLGEEARSAGVVAGVAGLGLIALFLIAWYRLPGLISVLALLLYMAIILAIYKLIPVVLTAAGIAGAILSIGMAVDANVLISERLKEELQKESDVKQAIEKAFSRAWLSVRDGNMTGLISAVVLYWAGGTFTKGFAVTLGIGVLVSMLTAITVTRVFLLAVAPKRYEGISKKLFGIGFGK